MRFDELKNATGVQPVHPDELWKNFKDALSEDFLRFYGEHTSAYNLAYIPCKR